MRFWFLLLVIAVISVDAKDLGIFGETFEIAEKDLIQYIKEKLVEMEQSGTLKEAQNEVVSYIKNQISHPQAVRNISTAEHPLERKFDPTIVVKKDIKTTDGTVFARAGNQFNPLTKVNMKPLLFIDGSDEKQIKWALDKMKDQTIFMQELSKIVLVKGSPIQLQKRLNLPIYFDQRGLLTSKFEIKHVPAIVFQIKGELVLTVREEVLP